MMEEKMAHIPPATQEDVQMFLSMHTPEQHAIDRFLSLPPKLQRIVMNKGSMADARDQSAVLIRRVGEVAHFWQTGEPAGEIKEGDWICANCLDVVFGKNSSCRKCGHPNPAFSGGPSIPLPATKSFSGSWGSGGAGRGIPSDSETHMMSLLSQMQSLIQMQMANQTGPSDTLLSQMTVTMSQMQELANAFSKGGGGGKGGWNMGDFASEFAKWAEWFATGKAPSQSTYGPMKSASGRLSRANPMGFDKVKAALDAGNVPGATKEEVDQFLAMHPGLEPKAIMRFNTLDPQVQKFVICKGSMLDARDQTAVLIRRCSAIDELQEGDWICPSCHDHQFPRNTTCRRCGQPNPNMN